MGAEITTIDFEPFLETARLLYEGPWVAERYEAIRSFIDTRPEAVFPVTREITLGGARPLAADAFAAMYRLRALSRRCEETWCHVDVLLLPTVPSHPTIAAMLEQPVVRNSELGLYTNFMNLLDCAGIAVPFSFLKDGLPFGVTFTAPAHQDVPLLHLARRWQQSLWGPAAQLGATGLAAMDAQPRAPSNALSWPHFFSRPAGAAILFLAATGAMAQTSDKPADAAAPTAEAAAGPWSITKHIDLTYPYVLRGATTTYGNGVPLGNAGADAPESSKPALQWGIDFVHASGWSFGYWASMINYSYKQLGRSYSDRSITDFQGPNSIENDFYGAYSGSIAGDLGYTLGMTGYYYVNGLHANAFETKAGLTYGPLAVNAQTLLNDTVWGNKGDTYLSAVYIQRCRTTSPLPERWARTPTTRKAGSSARAIPRSTRRAQRKKPLSSMDASSATGRSAAPSGT